MRPLQRGNSHIPQRLPGAHLDLPSGTTPPDALVERGVLCFSSEGSRLSECEIPALSAEEQRQHRERDQGAEEAASHSAGHGAHDRAALRAGGRQQAHGPSGIRLQEGLQSGYFQLRRRKRRG